MIKRFTTVMLDRIRPPADKRVEYMDQLCPGLCLRVSKTGRKTFNVVWKQNGKQLRRNLGQYPALGLPEAREAARRVMAAGPAPTNSLEATSGAYLDHLASYTASAEKVARCLELHVFPTLGQKSLAELTTFDINQLLTDLRDADKVGTAREVRKNLSGFLNWTAQQGMIPVSPMAGLVRRDLAPKTEAGRDLSWNELRTVYEAAGELGYPFGPLFRLLILTGQRRNDWAKAEWAEIENGNLLVPAHRYKSRRDHIVPLTDPAQALVDDLPNLGAYLFTTGTRPVSGFSKAKARLDKLTQLNQPFRIHDWRVSVETRLAELGFAQEHRDRVLGHTAGGLQARYNKFDYLPEKREALTAFAERLLA